MLTRPSKDIKRIRHRSEWKGAERKEHRVEPPQNPPSSGDGDMPWETERHPDTLPSLGLLSPDGGTWKRFQTSGALSVSPWLGASTPHGWFAHFWRLDIEDPNPADLAW